MQAVRVHAFGGPEALRTEEVPDPRPGPGEVLVRVRAAGVNPVDAYILTGTYARRPDLPYTPGTDGAGEIVALGAGVRGLAVGQSVYLVGAPGTYAELCAAPAAAVRPLPPGVDAEAGAALGVPYGTAYRALHHCGAARPGQWVLVHGGSGGVGLAAIQLARWHAMRIVASAGTAGGRSLAEAQGAHHAVDHADPGHLAGAVELTGGRGFDLIVEMRADLNLGADLGALATGGRVVVVGSRGTVEVNPRDAMAREAAVVGLLLWNAGAAEWAETDAALAEGLTAGALRPVIGRRFPLAEAALAHRTVMAGGAAGKVVVLP